MAIAEFYEQLLTDGHVLVTDRAAPAGHELPRAVQLLQAFDREYRQHLPLGIPVGDQLALTWSANVFYRAAQFLVYRELGPEMLASELIDFGHPATPEAAYGVDIVFRFLPDLMRIARAVSANDPLVNVLRRWGRQWPLSSVGMNLKASPLQDSPDVSDDETPADHFEFLGNRGLRRVYLDRIMQFRAADRLQSHPELALEIVSEPGGDWAQRFLPVQGCL